MMVNLPPDLAAKLEKVTEFRRGDSTSRKMASVARSILEVGLERELALIEGQPIPDGQVFYDAGSTSAGAWVRPTTPPPVDEVAAVEPDDSHVPPLERRLRDLDLLPRRSNGNGGFDPQFVRTWAAYVEDIGGSAEEALDAFELELAEVGERLGRPVDNPRAYFMGTRTEA